MCVTLCSKKQGEGESEWEARERRRRQTRGIWMAGQKGLTDAEAAVLIVEEAKRLLAADLAQMGVQWNGGGRHVINIQMGVQWNGGGRHVINIQMGVQ